MELDSQSENVNQQADSSCSTLTHSYIQLITVDSLDFQFDVSIHSSTPNLGLPFFPRTPDLDNVSSTRRLVGKCVRS